ncbi:hypothetical protein DPMN_121785 [Dreissena polymorpha]|uniref:Uncharacterized protein n=1 Tax=Dreissena polymorpha TaxID=45954 RepID=A0A9D4JPV9_DREPO|nr:hypothetical protein DPMN_121785 [Dreissena polymorpha]
MSSKKNERQLSGSMGGFQRLKRLPSCPALRIGTQRKMNSWTANRRSYTIPPN